MNLGFNTSGNSQTSGRTTQAILGLGSLRNTKGSLTRKFKYCNARDRNVVFQCVFNQPIPAPTPSPSYSVTGIYTISSNSQYNTIITFTGNGTFTINLPLLISYLVVGGAGGGGGGFFGSSGGGGGGGGGGGVIENSSSFVGSYTITIGTGGLGGSNLIDGQPGISGGSSSIIGSTSYVANGGFGGSINGGASGTPLSTGGTGDIAPISGAGYLGGGGGGAGYTDSGGNGSVNISTLIYGTIFGAGGGGGGGGSGSSVAGTAGNSNAGDGGNRYPPTNAGNGVANTGGGGGGGSQGSSGDSYVSGGNGGSGVVILLFNV